ncbi:fluoride efflux transporter CrcB [Actinomadura fulvescens]|uniref:Fluoride-specific ion channel FluC n=1 Tax=Actinomadura fulvescens TaxID=46160 RepID=A0ABP6C075_9ACTN
MTLLLVFAGGAVGAPARYVLDRMVTRWVGGVFPWGTLVVNVLGSVILGVLAGAGVAGPVSSLAGTGFCGAFTTFSTFGYETVRLVKLGEVPAAGRYAVGSLVVGVGAAALAYAVAAALTR